MTREPSDWGIPDWRDPKAYPSDGENDDQFFWEFTRRREDYRRDWWEAIETKEDCLMGFSKQSVREDDPRFIEPINSPNWISIWVNELIGKYDLNPLPHPSASRPVGLFREHYAPKVVFPFEQRIKQRREDLLPKDVVDPEISRVINQEGRATIIYDINRPIAPQLDYSKRWLEFLQLQAHDKLLQRRKMTCWSDGCFVLEARMGCVYDDE